MNNFSKALKYESDLVYAGLNLEYFNKMPEALRAQFSVHYFKILKVKDRASTYKKINELVSMFTASPQDVVKQAILDEAQLRCLHMKTCRLADATYVALAILTFPLIKEIIGLLPSFADNYFTPAMMVEKVTKKFASDATKKDCVYHALKTLKELQVLKQLKKGMFKQATIPVFDAQGIAAVLSAIATFCENPETAKQYLKGFEFVFTKEFIETYPEIPYESIVPKDTLETFYESTAEFQLQFNGEWSVSKNDFKYCYGNVSLIDVPKFFYVTPAQVILARMQKKERDEYKKQSLAGITLHDSRLL